MLYKLLPTLLLLALGALLGRRRFLSPAAQDDLKRLVANVALPAGLFLSFARVTLEARLLIVPALVFAACLTVFLLAKKLVAPSSSEGRFSPFLVAGFEAGMLGYAVFTSVYGAANIYKFGLIDLGQVIFVFFILAPALQRQAGKRPGWIQTAAAFLSTPVILAILGGILFNRLGLNTRLDGNPVYGAAASALSSLSNLTTPLVAFIIGAQLAETRLSPARLAAPARLVAVRLLVWVPAAALLASAVLGAALKLDPVYQVAALTMAVLPPPFVVPLYLRNTSPQDDAYVINCISLSTLAFIPAFALATIFYSGAG